MSGIAELSSNHHDLSSLCEECRNTNFGQIYDMAKRNMNRRSNEEQAVTKLRRDYDPNCNFCKLVESLITFDDPVGVIREHGYTLIARNSLDLFRVEGINKKSQARADPVIACYVDKPQEEDEMEVEQYYDQFSNGVIVPIASFRPSTKENTSSTYFQCHGRAVQRETINYAAVKSWLRECMSNEEGGHKPCQLSPYPLHDLAARRVIDCNTREIVTFSNDKDYFALSYVWGSGRNAKSSLKFVPEPAPATIEDAMLVVQELGWRYLWVDRYCINEDDEDIDIQIEKMGLVYERAIATIAAVSATGSETGLPGLSYPRKTDQVSAIIYGSPQPGIKTVKLVSTMRHLSKHALHSMWAKRGWTYQETFLARRCLFFTDDQVFFACRTSTQSESVERSPLNPSYKCNEILGPRLLDHIDHQLEFVRNRSPGQEFSDHVKNYTLRHLSFSSDGLNAFKGQLSQQKEPNYFGIPFLKAGGVSDIADLGFSFGLTWRVNSWSDSCVSKRAEFPTWCWASVEGEVNYSDALGFWEHGAELLEDALISVVGENDELTALSELLETKSRHGSIIPTVSFVLEITGLVGKVTLRHFGPPYDHFDCRGIYPADSSLYTREELGDVYLDLRATESMDKRLDKDVWEVMFLIITLNDHVDFDENDESVEYKKKHCRGILLDKCGSEYTRLGCVDCELAENDTLLPMVRRTIRLR